MRTANIAELRDQAIRDAFSRPNIATMLGEVTRRAFRAAEAVP